MEKIQQCRLWKPIRYLKYNLESKSGISRHVRMLEIINVVPGLKHSNSFLLPTTMSKPLGGNTFPLVQTYLSHFPFPTGTPAKSTASHNPPPPCLSLGPPMIPSPDSVPFQNDPLPSPTCVLFLPRWIPLTKVLFMLWNHPTFHVYISHCFYLVLLFMTVNLVCVCSWLPGLYGSWGSFELSVMCMYPSHDIGVFACY